MEEELIILVIYVNVNGLSHVMVNQMMNEIIESHKGFYDDVKNKNVKTLYFPVIEGETRVECVYPVGKSGGEVESQIINLYKAVLNSSDEQIKDFVQEVERKLKLIKIKGNF